MQCQIDHELAAACYRIPKDTDQHHRFNLFPFEKLFIISQVC